MKRITLVRAFSHPYLLLGFLSCLAVYRAFLGEVSVDEFEAVHTAWKILNGEVIYRDFFQHHHSLLYYTLIPLIKFGGESVVTFYLAEGFTFLIFAGIVVTTFFLAEKVYGDRKTAWFSVILLLAFPFFVSKGTETMPDVLQVLLGLLSVYFLAAYLKGGARKHLVLSALLLSLSFLALQKAVFLIFAVGLFLLYCLLKAGQNPERPKITPKITKKDFFLYWAVFSAPPALYAVFLLATGDWQNYFDFNWLLNMKFLQNFSPFGWVSLLPSDIPSSRKFFDTLIMAGFVSLFIYGFGCSFKTDKLGGGLHGFAVLAGGVLGASLFLVRAPYTHYFLAAAPFVSMVAAFSLRRLFGDATAKAVLAVFVLLCAFSLVLGTGSGIHKKNQILKLQYVLSVSGPEDSYFGSMHGLFRKDASFFWFCTHKNKCLGTYQSFRDYDFDPVRILKKTRPRVIYVPLGWPRFYASSVGHPEIASDYESSPEYPDIYIRKDGR